MQVPCVAVVENMSYFEVDGVKHYPFGRGSGDRIVQDFGLPHLMRFPITPDLSEAGDGEPRPACSTQLPVDQMSHASITSGSMPA